jgi:hypothetical protein
LAWEGDLTLEPLLSDNATGSLQKINGLVWNIADAGGAGLMVAKLAPSTFAAYTMAQPVPIESQTIAGNALFEIYPPDGVTFLRKALVQLSAWTMLAETVNSDKSILTRLDTTATYPGQLLVWVQAPIVNNVGNAALGGLVNAADIIRVLFKD